MTVLPYIVVGAHTVCVTVQPAKVRYAAGLVVWLNTVPVQVRLAGFGFADIAAPCTGFHGDIDVFAYHRLSCEGIVTYLFHLSLALILFIA
jgi:hypothetical protein